MPRVTASDVLRLSVVFAGMLPLARLFGLAIQGGLTANPLEFVTRSTGTWALVFLCLSLSVTPYRRLGGPLPWPGARRAFGLYSFFYAVLHAALWVAIDRGFDGRAMLRDVFERPFIAAGCGAFLLMLPLAATSTRAMIVRLGRLWKPLHRTVYAIAVLALLHYAWHKAGKNDFFAVGVYASVVAALLGIRLVWAFSDRVGRQESRRSGNGD